MPGFTSLLSASLRIASLDLCADEYLLMFAAPDQVASVSFLSRDPTESPLSKRASAYPGNDGTVEGVLGHAPDVLLSTRPVAGARADIARRLGMRVVVLPYADTPQAVSDNVAAVAELAGQPSADRAWQKRFDALRRRPAVEKALWLGPGGLGMGDPARAWLEFTRFQPIAARPGLSRIEAFVAASPDILLVSNYRSRQYSRNTEWLDHPLVRERSIPRIEVDGRRWTCGGPLMLGEIEKLQRR